MSKLSCIKILLSKKVYVNDVFDDSMSSLSSSKYITELNKERKKSHFYYLYWFNSVMYFELDNDDMESSGRRSLFISLIFVLRKCCTKPLTKGVNLKIPYEG